MGWKGKLSTYEARRAAPRLNEAWQFGLREGGLAAQRPVDSYNGRPRVSLPRPRSTFTATSKVEISAHPPDHPESVTDPSLAGLRLRQAVRLAGEHC